MMPPQRQRWSAAQRITLHQHSEPYLTLVLSGGYEEAGDSGRHRASAADVLLHGVFDTHQNRIERSGAQVLNLPAAKFPAFTHARIHDPDAIVRLAERDIAAAAAALVEQAIPTRASHTDWPDQLGMHLMADPTRRIGEWAAGQGLASATVSRGFKAAYGMSACTFRSRTKARNALRIICGGETRLAFVACEAGFADQAAMTRALVAFSGSTPGRWRVKSRQDRDHGRR
jgi:AraC-like DNA-binding protein